ncbi:phosphogluconate dehydrogenase C-terminal domain-containing protein [Sulfitobacter sp. D35]|uniref:phosphogluconate dehydrogenase C-terminal domain-containing protein n=1 Tax=Sulfitobacter sp. D35 TaxID=3083252 RepID=UPI0029700399|nr:phosphogluconate dehydrogenase C-terminal domain-containing protein [Sulfitobacter sp. D35]MDW4499922.1 phosphogluconate dehydrogenase C-terminal domain-containing protein [Sulfitobacter sp. D35]
MTEKIAILGAGGKMGFRITKKIFDAGYDLTAIEIGEDGRARLREASIPVSEGDSWKAEADVIVLALPDSVIGKVATDLVPRLRPGAMVLILDAAAPYAGVLPEREDVTYFIGHPCHPPLYNDETEWDARRDYHGGVAEQAIVCALMQGPEEHYDLGREICEAMWSPVIRTHRVTLEQLAILEPGLSEMVAMPFIDVMVEAVDECAEKYGIDRQAAFDFMIGHLNVEIAMWFGFAPKVPSDAALRLMRFAKSVVVKDTWRDALDPGKVREASELIVKG